jgi:hypothetical protein
MSYGFLAKVETTISQEHLKSIAHRAALFT